MSVWAEMNVWELLVCYTVKNLAFKQAYSHLYRILNFRFDQLINHTICRFLIFFILFVITTKRERSQYQLGSSMQSDTVISHTLYPNN